MTQILFDLLKQRDAWIIRLECMEFKLRTGLKDFRLSDRKDAILTDSVTLSDVSQFRVTQSGTDIIVHLGHGVQRLFLTHLRK